MTLLLILSAPLIVMLVARWVWRRHLQALQALGRGLASRAGAATTAAMAQVVSVLVAGDTVLVGLRACSARSGRVDTTSSEAPASSVVFSLAGQGWVAVPRLERWQASGAAVVVWRNEGVGTIEICQLQTGQRLRLPIVNAASDGFQPSGRPAATT